MTRRWYTDISLQLKLLLANLQASEIILKNSKMYLQTNCNTYELIYKLNFEFYQILNYQSFQ